MPSFHSSTPFKALSYAQHGACSVNSAGNGYELVGPAVPYALLLSLVSLSWPMWISILTTQHRRR